MVFNNSISYKSKLGFEFSDNLKNQEVRINIWKNEVKNDSLYSNHTFQNQYDWDDFYYNSRNVRLFDSNMIKIG